VELAFPGENGRKTFIVSFEADSAAKTLCHACGREYK
jgi:hypothetical protein